MSAVAATASSKIPQTWSLGPVKVQVFDVTLASGNTSVTVTADRMTTVYWAILANGTLQTAAPSYSGNTATFTITDPLASGAAQAIVFGV
jgi:hypothetical protein